MLRKSEDIIELLNTSEVISLQISRTSQYPGIYKVTTFTIILYHSKIVSSYPSGQTGSPFITVKILKFGTPQTIAIIVLKIEKFDVTLH